jgi:hypothetical protein
MSEDFILKVHRFDPRDRRLGRHVVHDSRSRRFAARAADPLTLKSVRHAISVPILDQGQLGSCTGHAGVAAVGSGMHWPNGMSAQAAHAYAVDLYSAATKLDPWPGEYEPEDTGSDGLSIAKVLQQRGVISGYQHALSLPAALTALAEGPVIVGTTWLDRMFDVGADGHLNVSGSPAGGHEYALDELDVERQRAWIRNSWGEGWGVAGRAWMSWDELGRLLADEGDCTVLVPRTEPAPQPQPAPEPAMPAEDRQLAAALRRFLPSHAMPVYLRAPAQIWLKTKE